MLVVAIWVGRLNRFLACFRTAWPTDGRTDGWMDGQMDGWSDGQMEGLTIDQQMDGPTNKPTECIIKSRSRDIKPRKQVRLKDTESYIRGIKWSSRRLFQSFVISTVFILLFWPLYDWIPHFKPFSKVIWQVKIRVITKELWWLNQSWNFDLSHNLP